MRIIGGTHGGRRIKTVRGSSVRPTSDRLRETLFNILGPLIEESAFLDLCAGSGAAGLEALSRGACSATLVERGHEARSCIRENFTALGLAERALVLGCDVLTGLRRLEKEGRRFDIVFFDPPYSSNLYEPVLTRLGSGKLLATGAVVVVEHRAGQSLAREYADLVRYREVTQGDSALSLFKLSW